MKQSINFLLYNPNFVNGAGATTRILSIINHLQNKYDINIYIFLSFNRLIKILFSPLFRHSFYKSLRTRKVYFLFVFAPLFRLYRLDYMLITFYNKILNIRDSIIQCETEVPGYLSAALKAFNNKVILDKHGLIYEETKYKWANSRYNKSKKIEQIKEVEISSHNNSDLIICVSHLFKKVLRERYNYNKKIFVLPMLINHRKHFFHKSARNRIREELGINDKLVIVYSGSMSKYQKLDEMLNFFCSLQSKTSNSFFLILSQSQFHSGISRALKLRGIKKEDYHLCQVRHDQVNDYLSSSDMGLLFRENILLNNVASPTKFLEYLSAGVYPIISSKIGDTEEIISEMDYGFVSEDLNFSDNIDEIIYDYEIKVHKREEVSLRTRINYNWKNHIKKIEEIYAK